MRHSTKPFSIDDDLLWHKDAIIYEVHVRAFYDSNRDGIGDFGGLTEKLDYLHDLGITAIWLLPFYPSPLKDDGYDISDYMGVNPAYGSLRDFKRFLNEAHQRGLRVITELVLNHTSDQHPWFQRARRAEPGTKWRDFYVWSDSPDKYKEARIIFKDFESSNWNWDPIARAYYWHRFYSHQPDLNYDNPDVQHEIFKVVDFWLRLGVDGLRLDAVPYLYEEQGTNCENLPKTHQFLKALRQHVDQKFKNRMLIAEANQWPEDAVPYLGNGDECHLAFHFPLMPRLFMAVSMEDHFPVMEVLENTPPIPDTCQWAIFLRNHDELTLEMVTDEQRDYMYRVYARDDRERINLGIRHRLAPLLGNHRKKIELVNSLLFSLTGSPVVYYGDEIGMGDNIYLGDRDGVRTPMQWSADRNAGFSQANPQRLYLPTVINPAYHYEATNVEVQQSNPYSLLWWTKRLIALRKRFKAFGRGTLDFLHPENPKVLAFIRRYQNECILVVANLSRFVQGVELDLSTFKGMVPIEIFGRNKLPPVRAGSYFFTLGPHDFYWFSLEPEQSEVSLATKGETRLPAISVAGAWEGVLRGIAKTQLEAALPAFLKAQHWFDGKARAIRGVEIAASAVAPNSPSKDHFTLIHVDYAGGDSENYLLPIAFATRERSERVRESFPLAIIASLKTGGSNDAGVLYDATWSTDLARALFETIIRHRQSKGTFGEINASLTPAFRSARLLDSSEPINPKVEQNNTTIVFGDQFVLKLFRRIYYGINPDLEIRRFLTERTSFCNTPRVAGFIESKNKRGELITLAILDEFVPHQGDGWQYTLDILDHYLEQVITRKSELLDLPVSEKNWHHADEPGINTLVTELIGPYFEFVRLLGKRTAELHLALSLSATPAFAPEPFTPHYQRGLYEALRIQGNELIQLARKKPDLHAIDHAEVKDLQVVPEEIAKRFRALLDYKITATRIRCHGDYRLGQVRYTGKDFIIASFEGDATRPISERRIKRSPLTDVACMLLSFQRASLV
ncbi:partial maltose alpha-D-glucosyltransferase / alpha-amylase, partial [Anaerolineae bacterium]